MIELCNEQKPIFDSKNGVRANMLRVKAYVCIGHPIAVFEVLVARTDLPTDGQADTPFVGHWNVLDRVEPVVIVLTIFVIHQVAVVFRGPEQFVRWRLSNRIRSFHKNACTAQQ